VNDLYDLDSIDPSYYHWVGEKAIALSQLSQKGYPILPGVIVGSQVLDAVLDSAESFTEIKLGFNSYETLQQTAQKLSETIHQTELEASWCEALDQKLAAWQGKPLIFRPSLVLPPQCSPVSGLLGSESALCEPKEIEFALKRVWASFFRARHLFYWQQQDIPWQTLGLAVLIQSFPSPSQGNITSGILDVRGKNCSVQAVRGLGHSLVWGEVSPETYEIDLTTQAIKQHQLGYQTRIYQLRPLLDVTTVEKEADKAILSSTEVSELIKIAASLQTPDHSVFTCEWVFVPEPNPENGSENRFQLYLTQFSPEVTMLADTTSRVLVKGLGSATGKATGTVYVIGQHDHQPFPPEGILVTTRVTTQSLPLIKRAKGLITEQGGLTSHAAILARELKIPAVVGATGAITALAGETTVTVDGDQGEVLRASSQDETVRETPPVDPPRDRPILATQLMVNASQENRASQLSQLPVDGVGLIRSELMLLGLLEERSLSSWLSASYRELFIQRLADLVGTLAAAFSPRPVFYRATDWLSVTSQEIPLLGERGAYSYGKHPELFSAQMFALRYLQEHHGYNNINLILPFVRSVEEVQFCKTLLTETGLKHNCQLWIMAEVPSVIYLLPEYVKAGVEGIAIGTNDLTQLLLGVDREKDEFREEYNERHPALRSALKDLITKANTEGIPCSVCGQGIVLYPELVSDLVHWGVSAISVEESGVEETYRAIARSEKQLLLEAARQHIRRKG
jgi:pyruvate,water dikinase